MSYFAKHRPGLSLFSSKNGGLRACQVAASCAITAHFDRKEGACLIVMPTGTGKTALMTVAAFQLPAKRVLIVTPSVAVRDQIADSFRSLKTLRQLGVLSEKIAGPKVHVQTGRLKSKDDWDLLSKFDVVVGTPNVVSSHLEGVEPPPAGLFDLLVVDEAHHSAAPSYQKILSDFNDVSTILLTATPYRNDKKPLPGQLVYSFSLREALEDGILTPFRFEEVKPKADQTDDDAVCLAMTSRYLDDKKNGKDYRVMVRTDEIKRAVDLEKLYEEKCPGIELKRIDHNTTSAAVEKAVQDMKAGNLDGIIAVDMFGEGFDFPDLKACALHTPHGSLATTVQFFGRFARKRNVTDDEALFFAVVNDELKSDVRVLFEHGSDWMKLVPNLAEAAEVSVIELDTSIQGSKLAFTKRDAGPIEAYQVEIQHYVQVFVCENRNISSVLLPTPDRTDLLRNWHHAKENWNLAVFERLAPPEWTNSDALKELTYDYTFACIEPIDANLAFLFVASSRRSESYFRTAARALVGDRFRIPSMHVLSKLLHGITNVNCPTIGKRRHDARASGESYNTSNGRSPQRTITEADAARYRRGHVSVVGIRSGKPVAIGYSPGGRVWSPDTSNLVAFRKWCHSNSKLLTLQGDSKTGTELDLLKASEPLCAWTEPIVYMDWNQRTKFDRDKIWTDDLTQDSLYETEIRCVHEDPKNCRFEFEVDALGKVARYSFDLARSHWFKYEGANEEFFFVGSKKNKYLLSSYFLDFPPALRLLDGTVFEGDCSYPHELLQNTNLSADFFKAVNWGAVGIDIENELNPPHANSLHGYMEKHRTAGTNVFFKDHGSYEAADYILLTELADHTVDVGFFHCKGSSKPYAGQRQGDLQEVLRQAFTSLRYAESPEVLRTHMDKRPNPKARYFVGNSGECHRLLKLAATNGWKRTVYLVQPGLSAKLSDPIKRFLLHAVDAFGRESCALRLLGS